MPNEDQQEKSVNKGRPAPEHAPESSLVEALQALAKTPVTRENWRLIAAQLDILQIPGKQDIIADWERTFTQIPEPDIPEEVTDYGGPGFMGPQ